MAKLLKLSNLKKTIYYLKKNGFRKAYYAAVERASSERKDDYHYDPLPDSVLKEQAGRASEFSDSVFWFQPLKPGKSSSGH